ncbi:MAG TPA: DUF4190 domain-containing protein [Planctomycetaceae bacterium]|nr:DUF4190 domain-containing protein [Planctomycetaceae bacterium]HIQ19655.1 DUF4190 domain-containing protein [Planctomycetota bacterium]
MSVGSDRPRQADPTRSEWDDDDQLLAEELEEEEAEEQAEPYRAVSGLAVASMVFACLSLLAMADWVLGLIPLTGIVLGMLALRRIRRYPDTLMGITAARMAILISSLLWIVGAWRLSTVYLTEAPPGYHEISFKALQPTVRGEIIPKAAKELHQRRVYIKGYMNPGPRKTRIRRFVLVRDNGVCGFCAPKPKPTELIGVELTRGLEAEYTTHLVGVGGELTVAEDPSQGGFLYRIKADFFH